MPLIDRLGGNLPRGPVTLELDVRTWADDRPALLEVLRENLAFARAQLAKGAARPHARASMRNG